MSNRQRYRSGLSAPKQFKIQGGTGVIFSISDLVFRYGQYILPASSALAAGGTEPFESNFIGAYKTPATNGLETHDQNCLVETEGDHEYDLAMPASVESPAGTMVGPDSVGGYLGSQMVKVLSASEAHACIGILAREIRVGDATALVTIHSSIYKGAFVPA